MLTHYLVLGLTPEATDADIRKHYLTLVKRHPPESDPMMFAKITHAYEAVKDVRSRIHSRIFDAVTQKDPEAALLELASAPPLIRNPAGFAELLAAAAASDIIQT
jgi:DnaJ-class molecular chaperone